MHLDVCLEDILELDLNKLKDNNMKKLIIIIIVILSGMILGCEPRLIPHDPVDPIPTDTTKIDTVVDPLYDYNLLWSKRMIEKENYSVSYHLPIMYDNDIIYGVTENWGENDQKDQVIRRLNPDDQQIKWEWDGFNTNYGNGYFNNFKVHNNVFYGSDTKKIIAIDLDHGTTLWQKEALWSQISSSNGFLFYSDNQSHIKKESADLYRYDPETDTHELIHHIDGGGDWYNFLYKCKSITNEEGEEIIYFFHIMYRDSPYKTKTILYAYNHTKKEMLWEYSTDNETWGSREPIIDDDKIYFGTKWEMHCVNRYTGEEIWKTEIDDNFSSSILLVENKLIRVSNNGYYTSRDASTGNLLHYSDYGAGLQGNLSYYNGRIFYAEGAHLYIVDVSTGKLLYKWKTKNDVPSNLNFKGDVAIDSEKGVLYVSDWGYINCIEIPD